jgi:hypothetical protein
MAVIWREKREIKDKEFMVPVYKSDSLVTEKEKKRADDLDQFLDAETKKIKEDLATIIAPSKGKRNVQYWFELGKRLVPLFEPGKYITQKDIKYLWKAICDKAPDLFTEGRQERFIYVSLFIGKLPWSSVKNIIWTEWVDFYDIRVIRENEQIRNLVVSEIKSHSSDAQQDWTRKRIKKISTEFKNKDTSVFTQKEIIAKLESIFDRVYEGG